MSNLLEIAKFVLFFLLSYVVPGYVLIGRTNIVSRGLRIFLSAALGFALSALAGFVDYRFYLLLIVISLAIFIAKRAYKKLILKPKVNLAIVLTVAVILLGTFFQNLIPFRSGLNYDYGIGYWGALGHDGVWHQALVNQLINSVPPQNPGFSGTTLTNYHYFYDLLVAQAAKVTSINVADLIYRYYPILLSLLLGVGTYLFANSLFKNRWVNVLSVFMVYFGSSFGWIVEWIKTRTLGGESDFWANQPVSMNINPPFAISLVLLIAAVLLLKSFLEDKNFWKGVGLVLVSGVLIEFKVYGGLILLSALLALALKRLVFEKDLSLVIVGIFSTALALLIFLPGASGVGAFVTFYPFWIIDSMVDIVDRVGWPRLSLARTVGLETKNWPKFIAAEMVGLTLFIAGNLGTRVIAFLSVFASPLTKWFKDNMYFLTLMIILASLVPTLLFVQKGDPWNIIQFSYYSLYFFAVFAAYTLVRLVSKLPKIVSAVVIILFIALTPISSFTTFLGGFSGNATYIGNGELDGLNLLKSEPPGAVLTYPYNKYLRYVINNPEPLPLWVYQTSAYVSAYSAKETYLEDIMQQGILGNDFEFRLKKAGDYLEGKLTQEEENQFLKENNIKYVYFPKEVRPIIKNGIRGPKIFENDSAIIYRVGEI
jgi:hypothetical protein